MSKLKITGKKLKPIVHPVPDSTPVNHEGSMKVLALECWRIDKLIPEFKDIRKHLVLRTSVDRMRDTLGALGVAIDDPTGSEFKDGTTLNIAVFENSDELEVGRRIVSETLSPNIYINNKLAHAARVVVTVGRKDASHGA